MSDYSVNGYDIKIIQAEMLKIMIAIDQVCRKNRIRYILDGGTMLGAIRHQGFIPWDDDADLAMLREDYEKFITVANRDLPPEYRFECIENTKGKVRAVNTVFREHFTGKLNINHGIYIDIFPMDYVKNERIVQRTKRIGRFTALRYYKLNLLKPSSLKKVAFEMLSVIPLRAINAIAKREMMYYFRKSEKVCKLCHYGPSKPAIETSMFIDVLEVPFEGHMFYVPREYDSFLSGRYGEYMKLPPKAKQKPCHELVEVRL